MPRASKSQVQPVEDPARTADQFPTTSWSIIQEMVNKDPEVACQALDSMLQHYWYPIYVFTRAHHQCSHQDAEDLTQALMIHLLANMETLRRADPAKGTLRSYLLGCAKKFAHKTWEKRTAAKRDTRKTIAWDSLSAQERYEREPANYMDPARLYSRRWALILLDTTFEKLRAHYLEGTIPFEVLRPFLRLEGSPSNEQLTDVAKRHSTTASTLRVRIHRLRARWRELILSEIKQTLNHPTEEAAKAELGELLASL